MRRGCLGRGLTLLGMVALGAVMVHSVVFDVGAICSCVDASRNWVVVPCKLQSVSFLEGRRMRCRLLLRYTYEYDGRQYSGSRYDFHERYMAKKKAREVSKKMLRDRNLTCYVNPDEPEESVHDFSFVWWRALLRPLLFSVVILGVLRYLVLEGKALWRWGKEGRCRGRRF